MLKYVVCLCMGCDGCCVFYRILKRGAVCARILEVIVIQMLYVCILCAYCGSPYFCVLHDLQFVNAGRG